MVYKLYLALYPFDPEHLLFRLKLLHLLLTDFREYNALTEAAVS